MQGNGKKFYRSLISGCLFHRIFSIIQILIAETFNQDGIERFIHIPVIRLVLFDIFIRSRSVSCEKVSSSPLK